MLGSVVIFLPKRNVSKSRFGTSTSFCVGWVYILSFGLDILFVYLAGFLATKC